MHFNMVVAQTYGASPTFALDENSTMILMVRDLLFTIAPSKIGLAFFYELISVVKLCHRNDPGKLALLDVVVSICN